MRVGWKARSAAMAVAVLVLVAAAGCASTDGGDSDEQLRLFCADGSTSYPGSPAYAGTGPHPIRFYVESPTSNAFDLPSFPLAGLSEKWSPAPGSAQLAGCARRDAAGPAFLSCGPYAAAPTIDSPINLANRVPAHRVSYQVKVYEISTRRLVDTVTVTSERDYECPARIVPFGNGGIVVEDAAQPYVERNGAPVLEVEVTQPEAEAAFTPLVTASAR
jgi:hypothetical protein